MYYRGAAAAVVVYDITKEESFDGAKKWVTELQRRGDPNVVIALAGNKSDLEFDRKVETDVRGLTCLPVHSLCLDKWLFPHGRLPWSTQRRTTSSFWRPPPRRMTMSKNSLSK
jgi:hypothetical protein